MREQDLEGLFAKARTQTPLDSDALLARVIADAAHHQPRPNLVDRSRAGQRGSGLWAKVTAALGGNGVLAGLGMAAAAGIMIGFAQPASLSALTDSILAQTPLDEVELLPGIDAILTEG